MSDEQLNELDRLHAAFIAADAALRDAQSRPGYWASPTYHLRHAYEETADAHQHALLRHGPALVAEVRRLRAESDRLRRGDFTPEEFQAICHRLDETGHCTRAAFEAGCRAYQDKLFGPEGEANR